MEWFCIMRLWPNSIHNIKEIFHEIMILFFVFEKNNSMNEEEGGITESVDWWLWEEDDDEIWYHEGNKTNRR